MKIVTTATPTEGKVVDEMSDVVIIVVAMNQGRRRHR